MKSFKDEIENIELNSKNFLFWSGKIKDTPKKQIEKLRSKIFELDKNKPLMDSKNDWDYKNIFIIKQNNKDLVELQKK